MIYTNLKLKVDIMRPLNDINAVFGFWRQITITFINPMQECDILPSLPASKH